MLSWKMATGSIRDGFSLAVQPLPCGAAQQKHMQARYFPPTIFFRPKGPLSSILRPARDRFAPGSARAYQRSQMLPPLLLLGMITLSGTVASPFIQKSSAPEDFNSTRAACTQLVSRATSPDRAV